MVERDLPKVETRVRFSVPAQIKESHKKTKGARKKSPSALRMNSITRIRERGTDSDSRNDLRVVSRPSS